MPSPKIVEVGLHYASHLSDNGNTGAASKGISTSIIDEIQVFMLPFFGTGTESHLRKRYEIGNNRQDTIALSVHCKQDLFADTLRHKAHITPYREKAQFIQGPPQREKLHCTNKDHGQLRGQVFYL